MPVLRYYDGSKFVDLPGVQGPPGPTGPPPVTAPVVSVRAARKSAYTIPTTNTAFIYDNDTDWDQWDTQNAYNSSTGIFTVPITGKYKVYASIGYSPAAGVMVNPQIMLNGGGRSWGNSGAGNSGQYTHAIAEDTIDCVVGDQISFYLNASAATALLNDGRLSYMTIDLISGMIGPQGPVGPPGPPSTVVAVRAWRNAAVSFSGADTILPMDTEMWDTQNSYNSATGVFTCPVAGKYRIYSQIVATPTAASQLSVVLIYKNGAFYSQSYQYSIASGLYIFNSIEDSVDLAVGDTIGIYIRGTVLPLVVGTQINTYLTIDLMSGAGPAGPAGPIGPPGTVTDLFNVFYYQTIPALKVVSNPYTLQHNLGTMTPVVQVYDSATQQLVLTQVRVFDPNTIQLSVAQDMPNPVNVVVLGIASKPFPVAAGDYATKLYVDQRTPSLPAPVTSGSGVQSFTDVLGDVWVAANGVNGGQWKRARDVLHCNVSRSSAYTCSTSYLQFPWVNASYDDYSMWNGAGVITAPIPGLYMVTARVQVVPTAAGQSASMYGVAGGLGGNYLGGQMHSGGTAGMIINTSETLRIPIVNSGIQILVQTLPAMAIGLNSLSNRFEVHYLGTG